MSVRKLNRAEWPGLCTLLSVELPAKHAEIEVASSASGVQIETRWLPVVGLAYDIRHDIVEVLLEGLDHLIFHPREIYINYNVGGVDSLGILDRDSNWQIVLLRDPLMLPAPHT